MSTERNSPPPLAPPFAQIFAQRAEAEWGFLFLRQTLDLLGVASNAYRPCVLTLPKSHKQQLLRLNFGPWLLLDFCGPGCEYDKRINLSLLKEGFTTDPKRRWDFFHHPHDWRGVAIYHFTWGEVQAMDESLAQHYVASMAYIGSLFAHWRGSTYRLAHQPQIFDAIFDPVGRAALLSAGIDPFYAARRASEVEGAA